MARIRIQDPVGRTAPLREVLGELADGATSALGIFAFGSRQGINLLFEVPSVRALARDGQFELIVGISAVTDRTALERLSELQEELSGLRARVFWDRVQERLFHPKLCQFQYGDGTTALVVGSGNLTPGGLANNYEAFSILSTVQGYEIDSDELNDFLAENEPDLLPVDHPLALARAGHNGQRHLRAGGGGAVDDTDIAHVHEGGAAEGEAVFVAFAPRGARGWGQLQLNLDVLAEFFRIPAVAGEPLTLRERRLDGSLGELESRVLVYPTESNQNVRMELAAARGRGYPAEGEGRPIVLFRDLGDRSFEYIPLDPQDDGHAELATMLEAAPDAIGRGVTRVIRQLAAIRRIWPGCPW